MKLLTLSFLLAALAMPALAQWQRWHLSPEDQARFDSYYSRWQEYRQRNDRDQIESMEKRMRDVYARYNIPPDTPFWRVASNGRDERGSFRGRLSPHDQARFDNYYSRWQEHRRENNRDQIRSMEKRMQDVYAHYNIPSDIPYSRVATNGDRDEDRDRDRDRDHDR
jgi:hypothetical protein